MAGVKEKTKDYVFGLDIGTRSIVGTVGYLAEGKFHVVAQYVVEHETRAMLDGQIHDIQKVAEGIVKVKKHLEKKLNRKLSDVCVAAAGRVLRTVTQRVELCFDMEKDIKEEDVSELSMKGVRKAYEELYREVGMDSRFYCVGHTVMHYYVNDYLISNPEGHRGYVLAADMIATFLPDEVVDGLYKAVELADLKVANLTLEPIAAMHVAIPEKFRLLNLALVDVGAGTSDICITKDGTITAYGMLPIAGDRLTDTIATHYLVDFETAEVVKRQLGEHKLIRFTDIMGIEQTVGAEEVLSVLDSTLTDMVGEVAGKILELNGNHPVSAVFIVGGGGIIPGYAKRLAAMLEIPQERVAVRGREVMKDIVFENANPIIDSLMVTPIGICYSFYESSNNFIFVEINGVSIKLYDNGHLIVSDAATAVKITNEELFPRRGKGLSFTVNGRSETIKGKTGEPSEIRLNGSPANLYNTIRNGDKLEIRVSRHGENASMYVKQLPEMEGDIDITANGRLIHFPKRVEVNGEEKNKEYRIKEGDIIHIYDWYPLDKLAYVLAIPANTSIMVNLEEAEADAKLYNGDIMDWTVPVEEKEEEVTISPEEVPESQGGTGFDRLAGLDHFKGLDDFKGLEHFNSADSLSNSLGGFGQSASRGSKLRSLGQQISEAVTKTEAMPGAAAAGFGTKEANGMLGFGNRFQAAENFGLTDFGNQAGSKNIKDWDFSRDEDLAGSRTSQASAWNTDSTGTDDKAWLKSIPGYKPAGSSSGSMSGGLGLGTGLDSIGHFEASPSTPLHSGADAFVKIGGAMETAGAFGKIGEAMETVGAFGKNSAAMEAAIAAAASDPNALVVEVNGIPVTLKGKEKYVYVDVFNFYHFDLTPRAGYTIVTLLNGRQAEYMGPLKEGDKIDLHWERM